MTQATNINAYYRDLADAKQAVATAQGKVDLLEEQIVGMGSELPIDDAVMPEDIVQPDEVVAVKPLSRMNRAELNAKAIEVGVETPEELGTNNDVIKAITAKEGEK